jgi:hypothetical protein
MAKLSRKEFAAMCRTTESIVRSNISRKKITESYYDDNPKKKYIDTTNAKNKIFFEKYLDKAKEKDRKEKLKQKTNDDYIDVVEIIEKEVNKKTTKSKNEKQNQSDADEVAWDTRKKIADALLQERKAEKEALQLQKLAGKLIPVDLVFTVIRIHNNDIFATFQNDVENMASMYCDILAGGNRKKLSEIVDKLSARLDDAVKRAAEVSEASIRAAVSEYSETRNKGERK